MKTLYILILTLSFASAVCAQDAQDRRGIRWYVSPQTQVTRVNGETAGMSGFSIGWLVNDRLTLSAEAYDVQTDVEADRLSPKGNHNADFFYSGLAADYALLVTPRARFSGKALVGGAEAHWHKDRRLLDTRERDKNHTTSLVLEPGLNATVGLTSWMQAALGGSYRWVGAGKSHALEQKDMRGFAGTFGLRFGRF